VMYDMSAKFFTSPQAFDTNRKWNSWATQNLHKQPQEYRIINQIEEKGADS
jgi:hypothetical protein